MFPCDQSIFLFLNECPFQIFLFICLGLCWVIVAAWASLQPRQQGLLSSRHEWTSFRGDCSCCRLQALGCVSLVAVACRLCCALTCEIFPDRGLNLCLLHGQAECLPWQRSQPLDHQGNPIFLLLYTLA